MQGGSEVIVKRVSREFTLKEIAVVAYETTIQNLIKLTQASDLIMCSKCIISMLMHQLP